MIAIPGRSIAYSIITAVSTLLLLSGCSRSGGDIDDPATGYTNSIGMELAYIPAGIFSMGSPDTERGHQADENLHEVTISRSFRMSTKEVTQAQWLKIMPNNRSNFHGEHLPVEKVSWREAVAFCEKLSELEGHKYRLPTEAEWEYACRAGAEGPFSGGESLDSLGWYQRNSGRRSHEPGLKIPNAWGLYDMHGNVSEWCLDYYQAEYPEDAVIDPMGPAEGGSRVIRGGSWGYFDKAGRSGARSSAPESYQFIQTGFRVVVELSP